MTKPFHAIGFLFLFLSGCTGPPPDAIQTPATCDVTYLGEHKPEDFDGVRLRPDYGFAIQGVPSKDYAKESARDAADLFGRFHELPLRRMPTCVREVYRLTWVPSFHRTTVIRVWSSDDGFFATTKRLERTSENRNGVAYTETTRPITVTEWNDAQAAISQFNYWNVPSTQNEPLPNDGAAWLLEGMENDRYHSVFRILPNPEFERLIRKLFRTTGEQTEIDLYLTQDSEEIN